MQRAGASEWPTRRRIAVVIAAGLVWAFLWVGLLTLDWDPLALYVLGAFFTGPVIGVLSRRQAETAYFLGAGFVAALLAVFVLSMLFSGRSAREVEYLGLSFSTFLHWVPAFLVAPWAHWIAARRERPRTLP